MPLARLRQVALLLSVAVPISVAPRVLSAQVAGAAAPSAPAPAPRAADVASADAIIAALYSVISGAAGEKRDWDRFRSLFIPGARLIPTGGPAGGPSRASVLTPEDYVQRAGPSLEKGGFFEVEIARTSESFGRILHAFSTYESRRTLADKDPFARGINSIQMLNDGTRWWIVTVYWDAESPGNPIPARYLRKP